VQPFFFGSSVEQLFGVYHPPEAARGRPRAVVLAHPLGHEYLRAHRAFRNLAAALARNGWHVLRFDYLGSGDSCGDGERTTVAQCLADLDAAIDEIKDISGGTRASIVGLRLGATFAELVARRRDDIERVVLWDPVLDGGVYLDALVRLQAEWLTDRLGRAAVPVTDGEVIGFPLTDAGRAELTGLRLTPDARREAPVALLYVSEDVPAYQALRDGMSASRRTVTYDVIAGAGAWDDVEQVHQVLLPHAMVGRIAVALGGAPSTHEGGEKDGGEL
jgi:pimeloyl-ACP methyl ester carboxylesterase